jgi:hypothetical protein
MIVFTPNARTARTSAGFRTFARNILLGAALLLSPAPLFAQIDPGARLRVTLNRPAPNARIGTYESISDTTLSLSIASTRVVLPLANIARVEVSEGRRLSVTAGVIGFLLGGAAGSALGCAANRDDYGVFCAGQSDTKVFTGALLGGLGGAALGAILFRRERWRPVDLRRR